MCSLERSEIFQGHLFIKCQESGTTAVFIQQAPLSSFGEVFLSHFIWFLTVQKIVLLVCSLDRAEQRQLALERDAQFPFYIDRTVLQNESDLLGEKTL